MENLYYERLVNAAIRFVSFRPRSEKELRDFLSKKLDKWKVFGAPLIDKVITRMVDLNYVDDVKFAEWWVEQRTAFKPKGNRYIQMELRGKGVSEAVIGSVLAGRGSESLLAAAKQVVAKKQAVWAKLPPLERKKKLYTYLGSRGFDSTTIARVIDDMS